MGVTLQIENFHIKHVESRVIIFEMTTNKTKIENEAQYNWAMKRIDELLPKVKDETPDDDPNSIELYLLSALVEEYEEKE